MWQFTGSTTLLLFTLLSPVMVLGNVMTERRTGKRRSRRDLALWTAQRQVAERTLQRAVRSDEPAPRTLPDPDEALLTGLGPSWRPCSFCSARHGREAGPWGHSRLANACGQPSLGQAL